MPIELSCCLLAGKQQHFPAISCFWCCGCQLCCCLHVKKKQLEGHIALNNGLWLRTTNCLRLRDIDHRLFICVRPFLPTASIVSSITRRDNCAEVVCVACSLGTGNHQWETSADHLHSKESLDITADHCKLEHLSKPRTRVGCPFFTYNNSLQKLVFHLQLFDF